MGIEIERKYLVANNQWRQNVTGSLYCQGYIVRDPRTTVRVRIAHDKGYLTLKGRVNNLSRPEYEYEIPVSEAEEMLQLWCGDQVIKKYRYHIPRGTVTWEVDEFLDLNAGLVIAEVELASPDQPLDLPQWIGSEVSGDVRYYNSYLVKHPYSTWQT